MVHQQVDGHATNSRWAVRQSWPLISSIPTRLTLADRMKPPEKQEMPASVPVVQQTADEIPSPVFVPQTFRLPQRIIEDLARAGELRALSWQDREGNIWLPISSNSTIP